MLKIGSDYTPQISEFIVGEVISQCPQDSVYTFKVLSMYFFWCTFINFKDICLNMLLIFAEGLSEVQVPVGKFTIVQDEEERVMNDTITVNYAQMIEPRLISSGSPPVSMHSNN